MRPYSLHSTVTILDRAARVIYRSFRPYILDKIKRVYTIKLMIQYLAGLSYSATYLKPLVFKLRLDDIS
jgi:hypothetical protein